MQRLLLILFLIFPVICAAEPTQLQRDLARTYIIWQKAMAGKDFRSWSGIMAKDRQIEVKNRILSEKFRYPQSIFNIPVTPPSVRNLKMLSAKAKGNNAKAVFFGKVNFEVGGQPEDNLLIVSYLREEGLWKFVKADYVNLTFQKDVRKQILDKNYDFLNAPDFQPEPYTRKNLIVLQKPVDYITKVYAYCPGREVRVVYNERSNHLFQNEQEAEVAIGGAIAGKNQIKMAIKSLPGSEKIEPIAVRVYIFSQIKGVNPVKAYEYLVQEGGKVDGIVSTTFEITPEMINTILGK